MADFKVMHLWEAQFAEAYALVRTAVPGLAPDRWGEFARAMVRADGGVIGAYAGNGNLHAVAAYRPAQSLHCEQILWVEPLVTFELNESAPARTALCEALELLALAKGCDRLRVQMSSRGYVDGHNPKGKGWQRIGFDVESVTFDKAVNGAFQTPRSAAAAASQS